MPNPISGAPPAPPMFRTLAISASGLSAQRTRMDVIATNIANADTTRTPDGGPYRRRIVQTEAAPAGFATALDAARNANGVVNGANIAAADVVMPSDPRTADDPNGVRVLGITEDASEGARVYQPGHPDADADGYVTYPNVNVTQEMVDLMDARRLFEANATVFQVTKAMLRRSIDI